MQKHQLSIATAQAFLPSCRCCSASLQVELPPPLPPPPWTRPPSYLAVIGAMPAS